MIFNFINTFIESKFTLLNQLFDNTIKIRKALSNLDNEKISAGESNICYQTYISEVSNPDFETDYFHNVNVKIEFKFLVVNKDATRYIQIFDRYVYGLFRILNRNFQYKNSNYQAFFLNSTTDIQINNADAFQDDYYRPTLTFRLMISDSGETISNSVISEPSSIIAE